MPYNTRDYLNHLAQSRMALDPAESTYAATVSSVAWISYSISFIASPRKDTTGSLAWHSSNTGSNRFRTPGRGVWQPLPRMMVSTTTPQWEDTYRIRIQYHFIRSHPKLQSSLLTESHSSLHPWEHCRDLFAHPTIRSESTFQFCRDIQTFLICQTAVDTVSYPSVDRPMAWELATKREPLT